MAMLASLLCLALCLANTPWQPIARRQALLAGSSALLAVSQPGIAEALLTRSEAVSAILNRVPAYVIANEEGLPYLTEMDSSGRRGGFVFLGPRDAAPVLKQVQLYDPRATLAVFPLASVYDELARTTADAEAARARWPQPKTSTSTDMRLFQLRALSDENAEAVSMIPGTTLTPGVTLFYEPQLFLGSEAAKQRPYFFRLGDLNSVWRRGNGDQRNSGQVSPSLRVVSLEALLRQVEAGEAEVPPLLMPPSETAELEYKTR